MATGHSRLKRIGGTEWDSNLRPSGGHSGKKRYSVRLPFLEQSNLSRA